MPCELRAGKLAFVVCLVPSPCVSLSPPCASLLNHEMKIDHQKKKKVKWETFANGKACQTSINK